MVGGGGSWSACYAYCENPGDTNTDCTEPEYTVDNNEDNDTEGSTDSSTERPSTPETGDNEDEGDEGDHSTLAPEGASSSIRVVEDLVLIGLTLIVNAL